ncbi:MAG: hypothetical protein C0467_06665 [Planctomycetaceae bacterium]|nr:hypothetical protein [Planctomycetaceae bacterium]
MRLGKIGFAPTAESFVGLSYPRVFVVRISPRLLAAIVLATLGLTAESAKAQAPLYFSGDSAASLSDLTSWSITPGGPYDTSFASGSLATFSVVDGFGIGGSITVGGISATENFTLSSPTGTISNDADGVVTIHVAVSKTLDFSTQTFTSAATAGYIKTGDGILALSGGSYGGGFTLSAGTVVLLADNALGSGGSLIINGGIIASNEHRDLTDKFGGGIVIGGNFQLGDITGLASSNANLTFSNNVDLGGSTRTITLGNSGIMTFSGVISNGGLVVAGTDGILKLSGNNNYTGGTTLLGGTLSLGSGGALGTTGTLSFSGGTLQYSAANTTDYSSRFSNAPNQQYNIDTNEQSVTLASNLTSLNGSLAKLGDGILTLSGANTYNAGTTISAGTLIAVNASGSATGSGTIIVSNSGTLQIGTGGTVGSVSGNISVENGNDVKFSRSDPFTYSGTIIGDGLITQDGGALGTGTLTLTGTVSASTVRIASGSLFINGTVTAVGIENNGNILGGSGQINAPLTINSIIRPGNGSVVGTLTVNSEVNSVVVGGNTLAIDVNGSTGSQLKFIGAGNLDLTGLSGLSASNKLNINLNALGMLTPETQYVIKIVDMSGTGTIQYNGESFDASHFNVTGNFGNFAVDESGFALSGTGTDLTVTFTVVPVPESSAVLGIAVGALAVGGLVRRRLRKPSETTTAA